MLLVIVYDIYLTLCRFCNLSGFPTFLDIHPPTFGASCPTGPLVAYAEQGLFSALVNWIEPVAIDTSGIAPVVTSNYRTPQRFSQGSHVITYTAVDQSGNSATCSFTIEVLGENLPICIPRRSLLRCLVLRIWILIIGFEQRNAVMRGAGFSPVTCLLALSDLLIFVMPPP